MAGGEPRSFTEDLWDLDEKALIQGYIVRHGAGEAATALAILQARATLAAETAALEASRTSAQTRLLAWATIALAIATVALVVVAVARG